MVLHCMMVKAGPFVLSGSVYLFFNKNRESYYMVVNTLNKKMKNYFHGVFPNSNTNEKKHNKTQNPVICKISISKAPYMNVSKGRFKAQRLGQKMWNKTHLYLH